jgi:hypothetical protein
MAKRAKPGDVLAISVPDGAIYLHYLGRHSEYGDGVALCPRIQASGAAITLALFRDAYVAFYPVIAAVGRGLADVVGHLPSPGLPHRLRRPGARVGSKVATWVLEDRSGAEVVKRHLSEEERHLPIAVIWNHELLVQRVVEGWRPEQEGGPE